MRKQRLTGVLLLIASAALFAGAMATKGDNGCGAGCVVFGLIGAMCLLSRNRIFYE